MNERLVLTVLPLTLKESAPFHVSLHIAPKLTPTGAEAPLSAFKTFVQWGAAAGKTIALRDHAGKVLASARASTIDAGLWSRCFPADTPVRRPVYGDLTERTWASFPVKTVHDLAALTAVGSALWFPLDPPDLKVLAPPGDRRSDNNPIRNLINSLSSFDFKGRFADERLTQLLDAGKGGMKGLMPVLLPLHQARRFYEPVGGNVAKATPVPPIKPAPDFHERVAHYADQPELLRRLGLVIDLRVQDLAGLAAATSLTATWDIGGGLTVVSPRTPVQRQGDRLHTKSVGGDWEAGRLRLGDETRFAALAMDSDGAAMKLGNFVRALPRMLAVADSGDPGDVAPPALRSEGLTVVRTGRVDPTRAQVKRAKTMATALETGAPIEITTEDVTQGYRVEIWDDHEARWFSPHRRLATATLRDGSTIYSNRLETGWVQTAVVRTQPDDTATAYLHEAMFGWSGWSLSAPRPGPRAEPADTDADGGPLPPRGQRELVNESPNQTDITPVSVTTRVADGTLPRLRYGRSYAFRAWGVDLAGNSHGGDGPPPAKIGRRAAPEAKPIARTARAIGRDLPEASGLLDSIVRVARTAVPDASDTIRATQTPNIDLRTLNIAGAAEVDRMVVTRAVARSARASSVGGRSTLADQLRSGMSEIRLDVAQPVHADVLADDVITVVPAKASELVTPLIPFRRWDPVPPPVVVARHRYSPAESVHHMVIRSGVALDGKPSSPAEYLAETAAVAAAEVADWRATSERHLAAPKGSQHLNELHGRFDPGIDDPTQRPRLLAAALRDDGTLYDREIVSLDDPAATVPQPGVSLEAGPEVTEPKTDLDAYLGANRGDPIPAGHYVVHDVDRLALPWLPDPLAAGVALRMSTANRGSPLVHLFRTESTAARYQGEWPAPKPFRLVLDTAGTGAASADVADGVMTIKLPPGTRLDMRLSSSMRREDLQLMALWGLIPPALRAMDLVERPAADGQFWSLTPFQPITLVHATPRPVLAPLIAKLIPFRPQDATHVDLIGVVDCHAASTDRIEAEASWNETIDDLAAPGPVYDEKHAVAFATQLDPDEDMIVLGIEDPDSKFDDYRSIPGVGSIRVHRGRHEFGDTRHRRIRYAFRGTTRFREYFSPTLLPTPESRSRLGEAVELTIPSSAVPPVPEIDSVLPLFRWDESGDPGQPFGFRRRRRSGVRIYLKRPWFRTGEDEQLAVLLAAATGEETYSAWGADPVWLNAGPETPLVGLSLEDLYGGTLGIDKERGNDPRLSEFRYLSLPTDRGRGNATVIGYRPEYSGQRGLWYVDVAIEPAAALWPFVRLVVARYQANALPGLELSKPVRCDFVQLPPERTVTVSRPDDSHVRVTVTGPIGLRPEATAAIAETKQPQPSPTPYPFGAADITNVVARDRRMVAMIERREAGLASDLDWTIVREQELSIGGLDGSGDWAWTGVLPIGTPTDLRTPGEGPQWRVSVHELESMEGDPDAKGAPTRQTRTVYLDQIRL